MRFSLQFIASIAVYFLISGTDAARVDPGTQVSPGQQSGLTSTVGDIANTATGGLSLKRSIDLSGGSCDTTSDQYKSNQQINDPETAAQGQPQPQGGITSLTDKVSGIGSVASGATAALGQGGLTQFGKRDGAGAGGFPLSADDATAPLNGAVGSTTGATGSALAAPGRLAKSGTDMIGSVGGTPGQLTGSIGTVVGGGAP